LVFTADSGIVHDAIESAEPFHGKFHQGFGVRCTCSIRAVKNHVYAQFFFESLLFSCERPLKTISAPSSTKRLTIPSPIPLVPPVNDGNLAF
jgi:hypothetical protein